MANEWTLWVAIVRIVEADTGVGGVRTLMGKAHPLVMWGDAGMNTLPIIAGSRGESRPLSPDEDRLIVPMTFDVFMAGGTGSLPTTVRDRIEAVLTYGNLLARGVDAAPTVRRRRSLPELEQGGQREAVDIDFLMTR